jgi:hypothetical protein
MTRLYSWTLEVDLLLVIIAVLTCFVTCSGSGGSGGGPSLAPPPLEQIQILSIVTNCLLKPWPAVQDAIYNCTGVPSSRIVLFGPPTICDIDTNIRNYTATLTLTMSEAPNDPSGPLQKLLRGRRSCLRYLVYDVVQLTPDSPEALSQPEATALMWGVTGVVVVGVFAIFFVTILRRISFVAKSKRQLREFFSSEPMSELKSVVDDEARQMAAGVPPSGADDVDQIPTNVAESSPLNPGETTKETAESEKRKQAADLL